MQKFNLSAKKSDATKGDGSVWPYFQANCVRDAKRNRPLWYCPFYIRLFLLEK
jgi:hypothetical protein